MVAKRILTLAVALMGGIVGAVHAQPQAQLRPKPLPAIIALARNAVQSVSGSLPTAQPDHASMRTSYDTGYTTWHLTWNTQNVTVTVNTDLMKVTDYNAKSSYVAAEVAAKAGQQPVITKDQALNTVNSTGSLLGLIPGDWRLSEAQLVQPYAGDLSWFWRVRYLLYIDNLPVNNGGEFVYANAYDGSVSFWGVEYNTYASYNGGTLYPEDQALATAVGAFRQGGGPTTLVPTLVNDGPSWTHITSGSPLCALAYVYEFITSTYGIEAVVDAQTGELWRIECVTEGGAHGLKLRTAKTSPRYSLVSTLLKDKKSAGLGRAVISGKPAKKVKPDAKARNFAWTVDKRHVDFTLDAKGRVLAWKDGGKAWSGVTLSAGESAKLVAWLKASVL